MFRFKAHSDGNVIVPDEPVELPQGQTFRVTVDLSTSMDAQEGQRPQWLEKAMQLSAKMPKDLPTDLAEQHDHYIHGTPKR